MSTSSVNPSSENLSPNRESRQRDAADPERGHPSVSSICFHRVAVRSMPGFRQGGLAIDGLAEGVNVVYGPNASGKTTLTRAMQRLLRPQNAKRCTDSITGELSLSGRRYALDYHLGQVLCRSDGHETAVPPLAPAEVGERYILALHDLVHPGENEQQIVEQLLIEAAGGFDLTAAARELEFQRERPRGRGIKELSEYQDALRSRRDAEKKLQEIDREAEQLTELKGRRDKAQQAQLRQRVLEQALDALEKQTGLEQAQNTVDSFPKELSRLAGDEWERVNGLKGELQRQREKLNAARSSVDRAVQEIREIGLPEEGVSAETVATLEERCETLRKLADRRTQLQENLRGAKAKRSQAFAELGPDFSVERAAELDQSTLERLFKFIQQIDQCRQTGEAAERLAAWLDVVSEETADRETLREGIRLLEQWLAEQRMTASTISPPWRWFLAAGVTAVVGLVFAVIHLSWLLLLLPAAGLAAWPFVRGSFHSPREREQGPTVAEQWSSLGLPPPSAWTDAEVRSLRRQLQQQLAAAELHHERRQRFADLESHRERYKQQRRQIDEKLAQWRQRLGIDIDLDEARLYLLAGAIHRVQTAQTEAAGANAELAHVQGQHDERLEEINEELTPYVATPVVDAEQARALVRNLERRRVEHVEATGQRAQAEEAINYADREIKRLDAELKELFARVDLAPDSPDAELTLRQWCEQVDDYKEAVQSLRLARHDAENAIQALTGHADLLEKSRDELEQELEDCRRCAAELQRLTEQIGGIERSIAEAKKQSELEAALAREQDRLDELCSARERDAGHLVGNVLVGFLERQQREVRQPGVLKRAAELFAAVTHGRYQLDVSGGGDSGESGFRAMDNSLGERQHLDELSSGTRLQLLLAVRVAFVEQQEQGVQLPLIFDETLGNSDEQRARKIIESAVEIARRGRQVFYFTAQHDELAKWRRILREQDGVPHREFDLARLRGFSETEYAPEVFEHEPPPRAAIPAPEGEDWWKYGHRLNVPPLDCRGHLGGVHIWYVLDDVNEIHRLLTHDVNKWGQLQTLVEIGAPDGLHADSPAYRRAAASARLLEHLLRLWRQGRGRPVDRAVLEESGAVTDAFIDEVTQLAEDLQGDARRLIEALREGQVRRFRSASADALEIYLEEQGYLGREPVLTAEEIREKVMPLVFGDCERGLLSRERIDRFLRLVCELPIDY